MAKSKEKVNKSDEVRKILAATPDKPVKEVVAEMGAKGLKITPNLVYFLKGKSAAKKGRKKKIARAAMAAAKTSSNGQTTPATKSDAITLVRDAKELAGRAGGYEKLIELAKALAE